MFFFIPRRVCSLLHNSLSFFNLEGRTIRRYWGDAALVPHKKLSWKRGRVWQFGPEKFAHSSIFSEKKEIRNENDFSESSWNILIAPCWGQISRSPDMFQFKFLSRTQFFFYSIYSELDVKKYPFVFTKTEEEKKEWPFCRRTFLKTWKIYPGLPPIQMS